jgi:hypothetical protein
MLIGENIEARGKQNKGTSCTSHFPINLKPFLKVEFKKSI